MSRRQRPHVPTQHRWMVSYLDVLTILLIFFLTAAAKNWKGSPLNAPTSNARASANAPASANARASTLAGLTAIDKEQDKGQDKQDKKEVRKSDSAAGGPALGSVERKLKDEGLDVHSLSAARGSSNADAGGAPDRIPEHAGQRGLTINLSQAVLFSPGDDRIRSAALRDLGKIAETLRDIPNQVSLAGYADSAPIHNRRFHNNWELAAARSLRLREVLTRRYGIDPARVSISSYGSLEPKSPNNTPGGRARNRRVEILILGERTQ